jgi:hypothetical protein
LEAVMRSEPDNLVLAHLRELRAAMHTRFATIERRFDTVDARLTRMESDGLKALRSFVGRRSMVERTVADVDQDILDLKTRVSRLEAARS